MTHRMSVPATRGKPATVSMVYPQAEGWKSARLDRRLFLATVGIGAAATAVTGGFTSAKLFPIRPGVRRQGPSERAEPLVLGAQSYDYQDFSAPTSDGTSALLANGIIGKGSDRTVIDFTGPITTNFPVFTLGDTTRWNVIRIQSAVGRLAGPVLSGFTLRVSAPTIAGQLFNGLRIAAADDLLMQDVHVIAVPGTGNLPPFETFGLDLIDCKRPTLKGVVVDGYGRGGAGIGMNLVTDASLESCIARRNANSHGFACFQCSQVTFTNCLSQDNGTGGGSRSGAGFNHEESFSTAHFNSQATGNSLASFRYWAAHRSTTGHSIIRSYGDGDLLVQGDQSPGNIAIVDSTIVKGVVQD
jgi:hypothetical protein